MNQFFFVCVYLKIMISSSLSCRLLYCCKQMLQWYCLGWSPLLTALRRCDRDQWRSEFNRFVVVSNNVWERERRSEVNHCKGLKKKNNNTHTEVGTHAPQFCSFRWNRFESRLWCVLTQHPPSLLKNVLPYSIILNSMSVL